MDGGRFKLYDQLELQEFQDKYVIKSVESPDQGFSIGRRDGNVEPLNGDSSPSPSKVSTIYGVVGTIRLVAGTYVLVITSRKEVGSFLGFPVFKVMSMKFLSCNEALKFSTTQEKKDEAYFRTLLRTVESTPGLYYSYEADITLNLQRRYKLAEGWMNKSIWKQADPRFVWNRNLLEDLIESKAAQLNLKSSHVTITVTFKEVYTASRYSIVEMIGTRMWRRGANLEGDTANFIETEQLLEHEGFRSSFLQIRGSIPLLWEQIVDLSYKPRLRIINHEQTSNVVERHFHDLLQRYGETVAVDLTDKHGDEGQLNEAYAAEMKKLQDVRYVSFDFHNYCGNSNFDNIKVLYDQISEDFEKQGYFLVDTEGNILEEQKGVIRVNCIDCLDRTNVTQNFLAEKSLNVQLQRIGVLTSSECISMFAEEHGKFRALWAEQGDEISLEYAGTLALKGDLVRYGKQTIVGVIKDGMSALSRYYLNNFHDGDAMDLISGHYSVNRNNPSPFQLNGFESLSVTPSPLSSVEALISAWCGVPISAWGGARSRPGWSADLTSQERRDEEGDGDGFMLEIHVRIVSDYMFYGQTENLQYLPVASALIVGGLTLTTFTLQNAGRNTQQFIASVICAGVSAGVMALVKANGRQFCSRPRLCGLL
uniref:SAC domain-containing protein n=1 Tax=Fagus sylvatica TaxID=28930 RepID=A0A2N9I274_FAGSY